MAEQSNAELIAEVNEKLASHQWTSGWGVESLAERLAERLEAADQEIQRQRGINRRAERQTQAEERRSAELAAVVDKVRQAASGHWEYQTRREAKFGREGSSCVCAVCDIMRVLAIAPADVLCELKADVWDEGYGDCITYHQSHGLRGRETNPYREEQS